MPQFQAGFNSKLRIQGSVYTGQRWNVQETTPDLDVTNTEGIGGNPAITTGGNGVAASGQPFAFEAAIPGVSIARASVTNATFDVLEQPWSSPRAVQSGAWLQQFNIFLNRLTGVFWNFPYFLVTETSQDTDVKGLMPITFRGRSDGPYNLPGPVGGV